MLLSESQLPGDQAQVWTLPLTSGSSVWLPPRGIVKICPGWITGGMLTVSGTLLDLARPQASSLTIRQVTTSSLEKLDRVNVLLSSPVLSPFSSHWKTGLAEPFITVAVKPMGCPVQTLVLG